MLVSINGNPFFRITSQFHAMENFRNHPHTGIDLSMQLNTDLYSPINGIVEKIIDLGKESLGKAIYIKTNDGQELIFGHLSEINVKKGSLVQVGEKIAESGNTGFSTAPHLHIAVKDSNGEFINPESYVNKFQEISKQIGDDTGFWDAIKGKITNNGFTDSYVGMKESLTELNQNMNEVGQFFSDMKNESIWYAFTGEHFGEWLINLFKDMMIFVVQHSDVFVLAPALFFTVLTFFIGKNRTTKFIIPTWFAYFIIRILAFRMGLVE